MGKHIPVSQDGQERTTTPLPKKWLQVFTSLRHGIELHKLPLLFRKKRLALLIALGAGIIWLAGTLLFFVPSSLSFSVADRTCTFNPMLLPRLSKHNTSTSFSLSPSGGFWIGGYPVLSTHTCVSPVAPPIASQSEKTGISLLHVPFLSKSFKITPEEPPLASARFEDGHTVSVIGQLEFNLEHADTVFAYHLEADDRDARCEVLDTSVLCPLEPLRLDQGAKYEIELNRLFSQTPSGQVLKASVKTLDPVVIEASSIAGGSTVYDKPSGVVLTASKSLSKYSDIQLLKNEEPVEGISASHDGKELTISFGGELDRKTSYSLLVKNLEAEDGSQLAAEYRLDFATSGGPKVAGVSIGSSRVQPYSSVVLTFDSGLAPGQKLQEFVRIEAAGRAVASDISANGRQITINPRSDLPRCSPVRVILNTGLVNEFGVGEGEAWSMNSRTICQVQFSIGSSVRGRSITAYRFGSGTSRIVFVGGMHGNERSSVATMNAFINYLEDHHDQIPAHRQIIIIPNHNPDGYAAGSRTNANGVDLNRNFPASDWQSSVQMPGGVNSPQGGGAAPLDQPESAALASYINSISPRLVLTYHAVARVVISNDAGDSSALGSKYAADSGYRFTTDAGSDDEFGYATTGEFEDWLADARSTPAILIELAGMTSNQFSTHRSAIMNVVKLP